MKQLLRLTRFSLIFCFFALSFSSCEIINPSEDIPFYLRIDSISYIDSSKTPIRPVKPGVQNIIDAWVYVDGIFVGTFTMPAKVPVVADGNSHKVNVVPGVLVNAQSTDHRVYPFFTEYTTVISSEPGKEVTIMPSVSDNPTAIKYPAEAVGQFPEEFEGVGTIFRTTINSEVDTLFRTDNPVLVFDGNFSLLAEADSADSFLEFETEKAYSLPTNLRPIYLEVNYRTDVNLNIGLYVIDNSGSSVTEQSIITMIPTELEWKKLYLNLTPYVSSFTNSKYRIYFKAEHNSGLSKSQVLLDNFRIMYK